MPHASLIKARKWRKAYYAANAEKIKKRERARYRANATENAARSRAWYAANKKKAAKSAHKRYKRNKAARVKRNIKARRKLRQEILTILGGVCACCGENRSVFLCIDHINGGGSAHRKSVGSKILKDIKRQGVPKDKYRVLCCNCNLAFHLLGYCPHQQERISSIDA